MAVFSIELPDRRVVDIEAPDEATAVRGAREWHAANPQPELSGAQTAADVGESAVRGFNRGLANFISLPYRAIDWVGERVTGGDFLPNVHEMPAWRRFMDQPAPASRAGRYASAVGEAAGGSAVPSVAALHAAGRLSTVAPAVPTLSEAFLRPIASAPGTAAAVDMAANVGAGLAHESAREAGAGETGQALAGMAGGFAAPMAGLPLAVASSRGIAAMGEAAANRLGIRASADGGMPNVPPDAGSRAVQILADRLTQAGVRVPELQEALARIGESRRFWSSGVAQDTTALADLDNSLMRLAGSIARQYPEAARIIRQFIQGRQTGHTPAGVDAVDMAERGLPTRARFSEPITGAQAERALGRRFDTPEGGYVPMGMVEVVRDALRRAFLISDKDYHGHGLTGLRTEQKIVQTAKDAAKTNYDSAYAVNRGVNLRDAVDAVFQRHIAEAATTEAPAIQSQIERARTMFRSGALELKQFDRTKQALDDIINRFVNRPDRGGRRMGGALNALKNDLLKAVDDATGGEASLYLAARNAYSSEMEMLNALKLGRQAFRENSEVTADAFGALATDGERKLFRLGLLDSVTERGSNMPRGHDFTRVFLTPRVEEILTATIPRSLRGSAEFADRPERFGRYLETQARMIENRNVTQGGSSTARNLADDEALETLQAVALRDVSSLIDRMRGTQSMWQASMRVLEVAIDKVFGVRPDVAEALAHMLFTADPVRRMQVLQDVAQRMGPDRMARFNEILQQYQQAAAASGAANVGAATAAVGQQGQQ